jgi:hypothetical protein
MPTEFYSLAEITPSYTGIVSNQRTTFARKGRSMQSWRTAMQAGGWTEYAGVFATVTVGLNLAALPVRSPDPAGGEAAKLPGAIVCTQAPALIVKAPGGAVERTWGYDPGIYKEPPCEAFAYGWTQGETFDIFKSVLSGAMGMGIGSITITGDIAMIHLVSLAAGPDDNGKSVSGWVSGTVWGGGYNLRSGTYRDHFLSVTGREGPGFGDGKHHAFEMEARMHLHGDLFGSAPQRFDLWLDPAQSSRYEWRICVCPYQMGIWMDEYGDNQETGTPYPRSAVISMPWVPEGYGATPGTGHQAFAFVATGILANIRLKLAWEGNTWYDEGPWSDPSIRTIIIPVIRTHGERLTTTQGMLVAGNAYVMTRPQGTGSVIENRVSGKLWNCCVLQESYDPDTVFASMLKDAGVEGMWVHVSSLRETQKASLWWKVDAGYPIPDTTRPEEALRAVDSGTFPPEA